MSDDEKPARGRNKESRKQYAEADSDEEEHAPKKVKKSRAASSSRASVADDDVPVQDEENIYENEDQFTEFEAGQIMRVYVQDFMCHHKLTIDFGRHVNFVTGANGSGKSAVVAAIQLCLGATAGKTGRGKCLQGLIREGSDGPAVMRVTLLNEGDDAYKPDVYGNRITVERKINRGGGGGYKLLSLLGVCISQERKELEKILGSYNIYVDNPCCVLTQEESKMFIQGQEHEKYKFFLKATGLERTREELNICKELMESTKTDLDSTEKRLDGKKEARDILKKEFQSLMDLDKFEDLIRKCLAKLEWLQVYAIDDVLDQLQTESAAKEKELVGALKVLAKAEGNESNGGNMDTMKTKLLEIQDDLGTIVSDVEERKKLMKGKNNECVSVQNEARLLVANIAEHNSGLANVRQQLSDLRARALENAAGNERALMEEIEDCNRQIQDCVRADESTKTALETVISDLDAINKECMRAQGQAKGAETDMKKSEAEYRDRSDPSQGKATVFGRKVPDILRAIGNTRFSGEVIGPLGLHVKTASEPRWGLAIERHLDRMLSAFVVTNADDQHKLRGILYNLQCDRDHTIVCQSRDPRHPVPKTQGVLTVCDAINIENDLVFNCLVDQTKMESVILVLDEQDCKRYFGRHNGLDGFKDNKIRSALTENGTKIEFKGGNMGSFANTFQFNRVLTEDVTAYLETLKERIQTQKAEFRDLSEHSRSFHTQIEQMKSVKQENEHKLQKSRIDIKRFSGRKNALEQELAEMQDAGRIDTTSLELEETDYVDALEQGGKMHDEKKSLLEEKQQEFNALKKDLKQAERRKDGIENEIKDQEKVLNQFILDCVSRTKEVDRAKKGVQTKEKAVQDVAKVIEGQMANREEMVEEASRKTRDLIEDWDGEPVPCAQNETKAKLTANADKLALQVAKGKEEAGLEGRTKEVVYDRYQKAIDDYKTSKSQWTILTSKLKELEEDYKDRTHFWTKFLKYNAGVISKNFDVYLQRKGFAGTVKFNHKENTLHLACQTDNSNDTSLVKDVRQLSGGERSYATLCLLLALGHVIESPFRLMDEYDVFLDEVSRKVTLDELQKYALRPAQRGRQLLIITPNSLNDVVTSNDVRIKRMAAPSRGSAHGLQQQVLDFPVAH